MSKRDIRLYEVGFNTHEEEMKLVEYIDARRVIVEFQDEYKAKVSTSYQFFKKGEVKNPFNKNVYGVACLGNFNIAKINGKETKQYKTWNHMLERCYSEKTQSKHPAYIGCSVCDEWLIYENFERWFDKNYYNCENETMELDKDLLNKGNRIYNPNDCIFVPKRINSLLLNCRKVRGDYPIGVTASKRGKKYLYSARVNYGNGVRLFLGRFDTPEKAFIVYKKEKESYIKQVADDYANKYSNFPKRLYDSMYNYEVEITD